ncbi:MAG: hypothetical protein KDA72_19780, partial [Planctomycetales bacterium]|nr:hypothetical protein [Planctomycetales bacterium]
DHNRGGLGVRRTISVGIGIGIVQQGWLLHMLRSQYRTAYWLRDLAATQRKEQEGSQSKM